MPFGGGMAEDVVIVGGARTPFCEWVGGKRGDGKQGGLLKTVSAQNLGGLAIQGALEKTKTDPNSVDHVVMGYALQTCSQSIYGARHAGLQGGIPQCSHGSHAAQDLAQNVVAGRSPELGSSKVWKYLQDLVQFTRW